MRANKGWSIGQVAAQAGVAPSTIRYYEQVGLLSAPKRVSGQRRYGEEVVQKLGTIKLAQQAGFSITEIQSILHGFPTETPPSERWQHSAQQKLAELEAQMQTLQAMKALLHEMMACQCATLDECGALER
jgi:MerR family redox-sensitive transcriptional activator SoxR